METINPNVYSLEDVFELCGRDLEEVGEALDKINGRILDRRLYIERAAAAAFVAGTLRGEVWVWGGPYPDPHERARLTPFMRISPFGVFETGRAPRGDWSAIEYVPDTCEFIPVYADDHSGDVELRPPDEVFDHQLVLHAINFVSAAAHGRIEGVPSIPLHWYYSLVEEHLP